MTSLVSLCLSFGHQIKNMIKNYLIKAKDILHEYNFLILIALFIYMAIMITKLNSSLEKANKSIDNLARSSPAQDLNGRISISEMMSNVNFRQEFNNMQYRLEDIKNILDIVEINTRSR